MNKKPTNTSSLIYLVISVLVVGAFVSEFYSQLWGNKKKLRMYKRKRDETEKKYQQLYNDIQREGWPAFYFREEIKTLESDYLRYQDSVRHYESRITEIPIFSL